MITKEELKNLTREQKIEILKKTLCEYQVEDERIVLWMLYDAYMEATFASSILEDEMCSNQSISQGVVSEMRRANNAISSASRTLSKLIDVYKTILYSNEKE